MTDDVIRTLVAGATRASEREITLIRDMILNHCATNHRDPNCLFCQGRIPRPLIICMALTTFRKDLEARFGH